MKKLPKNQNVYVVQNRIYIDFFKNGKRFRKSTGLKHCALSFDFVKRHYDDFILLELIKEKRGVAVANLELKALQDKYYKIEDAMIEKKLKAKDLNLCVNGLENVEYSFCGIIKALLKEKAFLKHNTYASYQFLANSILSFLNQNKLYYLGDFKREHSVLFFDFLQKKALSLSTIKSFCFFMKGIFAYALENNMLIKSPFYIPKIKQKMKKKDELDFKVFSLEEALELIKHSKDELHIFLTLAFFTGARTGELLALKWEDLDFERNEIHIFKSLSQSGVLDSPKTKSSNRCIDMLPIVKKELVFLRGQFKNSDFIFNVSRHILRKKFNALLTLLNYEKRRLYDTRHSFASIMLSKGEEPIWVGCKMMGHKDLNETFRTYAKYLPKPVVERASFLNNIKLS
ncbi:tyrosine-type recombinase/integrase [Campylobacter upsaliensis]|nr:tyrosine-type recombinase/integrase [Campylobacter upsaliensis]